MKKIYQANLLLHHKPLYYRGTIYWIKYAHLYKSEFKPLTSNIVCAFPLQHTTQSLVTQLDKLFFILTLKSIFRVAEAMTSLYKSISSSRLPDRRSLKYISILFQKFIEIFKYSITNKKVTLLHYG